MCLRCPARRAYPYLLAFALLVTGARAGTCGASPVPELSRVSETALELALPNAADTRTISLHDFTADGKPFAVDAFSVLHPVPGVFTIHSPHRIAAHWTFHVHDCAALFRLRDDTRYEAVTDESAAPTTDADLLRRARLPAHTAQASTRLLPLFLSRSGYLLAIGSAAGSSVIHQSDGSRGETTIEVHGPQLEITLLGGLPPMKAMAWLRAHAADVPVPTVWSLAAPGLAEQAISLEQHVIPAELAKQWVAYRQAAEQAFAEAAVPVLRPAGFDCPAALSGQFTQEFLLGDALLVSPSGVRRGPEAVRLPQGMWVNYWTGAQATGESTVRAEAAATMSTVWVRGGSVLPLIDGERLVYTVFPGTSDVTLTHDTEGRRIRRRADGLEIDGGSARTIGVRLRFLQMRQAWWNGQEVPVRRDADGSWVELAYSKGGLLVWK